MSSLVLRDDRPDGVLNGVVKGDWVRLLRPHHDGTQLVPVDAVVRWWNDKPPPATNAALPDREPPPGTRDPYADRRPIPL